jgi:hypothetical protein
MTKEKAKTAAKSTRKNDDPVDAIMNELMERHPHLRAANEAMRDEGVVFNQFAQDALSAFRQRFGS